MPTDLTLKYHENHASPKDMTEVPKIHNQTTIIMATANIHKIIKTQAMKETNFQRNSPKIIIHTFEKEFIIWSIQCILEIA